MEDNLIANNKMGGMEVQDSPYYLSIRNNNITENTRIVYLYYTGGSAGLGISLVNTSASIVSNRIFGNLANLPLERTFDTDISDNLFIQYKLPEGSEPAVYRGVMAADSVNLNISDNRFYVKSEPILIYDCKNATIFNNTIKSSGTETYTFRGVEYEESITGGQSPVYGVYSERSELTIMENYIANSSHGVYLTNSTAEIIGNTITNNTYDGIYLENTRPPDVDHLIDYTSSQFDYRLTHDPANSYQPSVVSNDGNVYVVWIDDRSGRNEVYFKKSENYGVTWTAEYSLSGPGYNPVYIDLAIDGDSLSVTWQDGESLTPMPNVYVMFSLDGGTRWTSPFDVAANYNLEGAFWPSIDVKGDQIYLLFHGEKWTGFDFIGTSVLKKIDGVGGLSVSSFYVITNGDTEAGLTSNMKVDGQNIHVILLDEWNDDIEYWRSTDGGMTFEGPRSEERRVGKECRSRWSPYH